GRDVDDRGVLPIGYGYPNQLMAETYNSPGSPYWAAKAFLPLAVGDEHPFWASTPAPAPREPVRTQQRPLLVLCDDRAGEHVFALAGGQDGDQFRHGPEKYDKLAYSTVFGVSVPSSGNGLAEQAADSTLVLSEDGLHWRGRRAPLESRVGDGMVWTRWQPWPDVEIETWLWPQLPWHVRVHGSAPTARCTLPRAAGRSTARATPSPPRSGPGRRPRARRAPPTRRGSAACATSPAAGPARWCAPRRTPTCWCRAPSSRCCAARSSPAPTCSPAPCSAAADPTPPRGRSP